MVVVAVVGAVVCQAVLQAGPRGDGVTAAERNAVQQIAAVHVTPDTTGTRKTKEEKERMSGQFLLPPNLRPVLLFPCVDQFMGCSDLQFLCHCVDLLLSADLHCIKP